MEGYLALSWTNNCLNIKFSGFPREFSGIGSGHSANTLPPFNSSNWIFHSYATRNPTGLFAFRHNFKGNWIVVVVGRQSRTSEERDKSQTLIPLKHSDSWRTKECRDGLSANNAIRMNFRATHLPVIVCGSNYLQLYTHGERTREMFFNLSGKKQWEFSSLKWNKTKLSCFLLKFS